MYSDDHAAHRLVPHPAQQLSQASFWRSPSTSFTSSPAHSVVPAPTVIVVGLVLIFASAGFGQGPDFPPHHPGHVLVRFKPRTVAAAKQEAHVAAQGLRVLREYHIVSNLQLVEVPEGKVKDAIAAYKNDPNIDSLVKTAGIFGPVVRRVLVFLG